MMLICYFYLTPTDSRAGNSFSLLDFLIVPALIRDYWDYQHLNQLKDTWKEARKELRQCENDLMKVQTEIIALETNIRSFVIQDGKTTV